MVIDYSADDIDVLDVGAASRSAVCVASSFTIASTPLCDAESQFPSKSGVIRVSKARPNHTKADHGNFHNHPFHLELREYRFLGPWLRRPT